MKQAYRIIQHKHPLLDWYGLHIVTFDDAGVPQSYMEEPTLWMHSPENIVAELELMLLNCKQYPEVLSDELPVDN